MPIVRVQDTKTGHKHNWPNEDVPDGLEVIDEPTEDVYGGPMPVEYAPVKSVDEQTVVELQQTAERAGIDLAGATKKAEIVAKINEEQK